MLVPAIMGGRGINHLIDFNTLFLVTQKVKVFSSLLIIIGAMVALNTFWGTIHKSGGFLWSLSSLWMLPFYSSRLPMEISINWGDFLTKSRDYSWVYYAFSCWILRFSRFSANSGISFQTSKFIRVINMLFLIFAFRFILIM